MLCVHQKSKKVISFTESKKALENALENMIDGNVIVDKILEHTTEALQAKFDPTPLPDVVGRFKKRIVVIPVTGKASLSQGSLSGLSDIKRLGEAELKIDPASQQGNLRVAVTFPAISLGYKEVSLRFGFLRQVVSMTAQFPALEILLALDVRDGRLELDEFSVELKGELELILTGLSGPMVWAANKIRRSVREEVKSTSTEKVKEAAQNCLKLAATNVPIGI